MAARLWAVAEIPLRRLPSRLRRRHHRTTPSGLDASATSSDPMKAMYGIATVAGLAQVSVRTLRYYDELGLLRPVWTDPDTGHRWYAPNQLHRLHRILALRDLGVSL